MILFFKLYWIVTSLALAEPDIVYIGDSHTANCFAESIFKTLSSAGSVNLYGACSSQASLDQKSESQYDKSWLNPRGPATSCGYVQCARNAQGQVKANGTNKLCNIDFPKQGRAPSLDKLLEPRPWLTVVELGTNFVGRGSQQIEKEVEETLKRVNEKSSYCVWIGPPQAHPDYVSAAQYAELNRQLRKLVEARKCQYVDSSTKTDWRNIHLQQGEYRNRVHYECEQSRQWGDKVGKEITPMLENIFGWRKANGGISAPRANP